MALSPSFSIPILLILSISITTSASDHWNILSFLSSDNYKNTLSFNLKNYCESWRMNVELHNILDFDVIPGECINYISKYMTSSQYKADIQRATEEASLFLTKNFINGFDDLDAWIFDIDDTLLSTLPYYQKYHFGGDDCCKEEKTNRVLLEAWMEEANAPAVEHMVRFYNEIKERGFKIFLISSRGEHLRDATINNLIKAGYHGWTQLTLRCEDDEKHGIEEYKANQRKKLIKQGYRLWGNIGDQWSSLNGHSYARRSFKLPNPMYYEA
ncbi:Acid phosphatase protein [Dioscorea alata]|uniref:Acid phosphatase protein n=1 Tax=Dioscorea alata TaxID=55571 RepID=A0ACB7V8J8_DIOAL|nr:Acid phosphatase protein [Dioscorea alata]